MSPREKRWIVFIAVLVVSVAVVFLAVYYIPYFIYVAFILGVSCAACFYHNTDLPQHARLGLHPRPSLAIPPVFRRWLPGATANGVSAPGRLGRDRWSKASIVSALPGGEKRLGSPGVFDSNCVELSESVWSPRDVLMGSYLAKPEARAAGGTRELRERLARPNYAVHTPNRRLSFSRETLGATGRFSITPKRNYPLLQTGCTSMGVLPPAQWDGFRKKTVLVPRNSAVVHSPVTVKIARPDHVRSPIFEERVSSPAAQSPGLGAPSDPCSRETVLNVLRESRKREVDDDEDRSYGTEQKSKRRRHESTGSAHSAFEPLVANGAPSQLVPKPGSLKRGLNTSVIEETQMKRSRTSSTSSQAGILTPSGVLGSARNPIRSSYSSSKGYLQCKLPSSLSMSPLSSPGSSRCQTPERAAKKPREEEVRSPNSTSLSRSEKVAEQSPAPGKLNPTPKAVAATSQADSGGSEGKRKRKIPLVSRRRGDNLSLPPPPELGYTVTIKDLDSEKMEALTRIKKALEEPEPVKPSTPEVATLTQTSPNSSSVAPASQLLSCTVVPVAPSPSSSLSLAPTLAPTPVPNPVLLQTLVPGATTAPALVSSAMSSVPSMAPTTITTATTTIASNPLLEALKLMKSSPVPTSSAAPTVSLPAANPTPPVSVSLNFGAVKSEPSVTPAQPVSKETHLPQPSSSLANSAFAQVLAQPLKPITSITSSVGTNIFSLGMTTTAAPASFPSSTTAAISSNSNSNPLPSAFKPIFPPSSTAVAATTSTSAPAPTASTFKPLFSSPAPVNSSSSSVSTNSSTSLFNSLASTLATAAPMPVKPVFSTWAAPPTTAASSAATTGSTFQFSAASNSTPSSTASASALFQFGSALSTVTNPTTAPQPSFKFGMSSASSGSFPAFGTGGTTSTAPVTVTTSSQASFTFVKPKFESPAQFPAATANPFPFGGSSSNSTTGGSGGVTTFAFGPTASTAAPTFGTSSQPSFGGTSSSSSSTLNSNTFTFGGASATPAFGSTTQTSTPAAVFAFGGTSSTQPVNQSSPAQQNMGCFSFGTVATGTQFGTPTPANSTASPGFNFGASNATDNKPAFGTSTPVFGQSTPAGPVRFWSPSTPTPGFSGLAPSPFGASPAATFSIGSGSKPTGTRQRLQARRQHVRKK